MSAESVWWLNGELVDATTAALPLADHGVTVGDGCFETAKIVDGAAFALTRHLRRLRRSLTGLLLDLPTSDGELRQAVEAVITANPGAGIVRITVTGGPGPLGSGRGTARPTVIVAAGPGRRWGATAAVITVPWPRNERGALAGIKSTSYAENVVALAEAARHDASEAIFANTVGQLCEGTGTNIFVEMDGTLITPSLESGCLAGVTRELVLEITDVVERDVELSHLLRTSEAFLTSSTRDIMPISRIDDRPLPVGTLTTAVAAEFAALVARSSDP